MTESKPNRGRPSTAMTGSQQCRLNAVLLAHEFGASLTNHRSVDAGLRQVLSISDVIANYLEKGTLPADD